MTAITTTAFVGSDRNAIRGTKRMPLSLSQLLPPAYNLLPLNMLIINREKYKILAFKRLEPKNVWTFSWKILRGPGLTDITDIYYYNITVGLEKQSVQKKQCTISMSHTHCLIATATTPESSTVCHDCFINRPHILPESRLAVVVVVFFLFCFLLFCWLGPEMAPVVSR